MVVLWTSQTEKILEMHEKDAVKESSNSTGFCWERKPRRCQGDAGGPRGLMGGRPQGCMTRRGQTTLSVFLTYCGVWGDHFLGYFIHPPISPLRLDAQHFLQIGPQKYPLSPVVRNANK